MCGVTGILGLNLDAENRRDEITDMVSTLEHRGPDGWGYYISPDIALGQSRLSIVDLSTGDQPLMTENHVIVFNGEIFNYIELRKELQDKGVSFKTTSDTEVLLKAYEFFGDCFLEKLNGQFAVLIWNKLKKELFVARDRFGIRPLYILEHKGCYYFTSELKAFDTIKGYQREFNVNRLYEHCLMWNTFGDHTVYKNVRSIPGGSYARFKFGKIICEEKYYEIGQNYKVDSKSYSQAEEEFNYLLNDSVKLRLRSDVPVGAYLSGGIDSSVITHLIKENNRKHFKTFSITFKDKEFDESTYQNDMVKHIDSEHFALEVNYEMIDKAFPYAVYHTERPIFRTAPVPLYLLSKKVRESDIKVVLTGEGADEILWGYDSFKEVKLMEFWSRFPKSKRRPLLIKKLYPHLNHYKDERQFGMMKMYYEGFLGDFDNKLASLNIRMHNNKIIKNYFNKDCNVSFSKEALVEELVSWLPESYGDWSLLQQNQYLEFKTLLAGYLLSSQGDRMSLANSVEGRYPFLDHRIIDMLFTLNERYKLNGFSQKHLLINSFRNKIPKSITNRPKRPYMSPDLRSFIVNGKPTDNAGFFLSDEMIKDYGLFNLRFIQRFLKKFRHGIPDNIGYRDNMIITFILSTQIANYWIKNPRKNILSPELLTVGIVDY